MLTCIDPKGLLKNCNKLSTFMDRLNKQATKKATGGDGEIDKKIENTYKGDGFELLTEAIVRMFGADPLIQIHPDSYEIVDLADDNGVDATGIGNNGLMHTIQCKYFSDGRHELKANESRLTNFTSKSLMPINSGGYGVDANYKCPDGGKRVKGKSNMTIFHTGKGFHHHTQEHMMCNIVRDVNRKDIERRINNNNIFWLLFRTSWESYILKIKNGE